MSAEKRTSDVPTKMRDARSLDDFEDAINEHELGVDVAGILADARDREGEKQRRAMAVFNDFRQSEPDPDHSTKHCPCGSEFTWSGHDPKLYTWLEEHRIHLAPRTNEAPTDPVMAERERCAQHVEVLANMIEEGAGPLNMPAARLRQAAQSIRSGKETSLWEPDMQANPEHRLPTPQCGHGAQPWVIACGECGATPRTQEAPNAGHKRLIEQAKRVVRAWEDDPTGIYTENAIRELGLRADSAVDAPRPDNVPTDEVIALHIALSDVRGELLRTQTMHRDAMAAKEREARVDYPKLQAIAGHVHAAKAGMIEPLAAIRRISDVLDSAPRTDSAPTPEKK